MHMYIHTHTQIYTYKKQYQMSIRLDNLFLNLYVQIAHRVLFLIISQSIPKRSLSNIVLNTNSQNS